MKAVIVDKNAPLNLAFGERDEPKPLPNQFDRESRGGLT